MKLASGNLDMEKSGFRKRKFEETTDEHIQISEINSRLPPEMLEKVFSHLVPKDLNTVMLVCKTWNNVAEASPALWSWVKIRNLSQLSLKRLQGAPEIAIEGFPKGPWRELLQAVLQRPGLKKLSWGLESRFACDTPLAASEADLLTQFFFKDGGDCYLE